MRFGHIIIHDSRVPVLLCSIWYSVFNNALPVEHRGSSYWQCSNTESVRVGRFLKLLIRGSCVSLSVGIQKRYFHHKETQKNVANIRKVFSIYTIF